MTNVSRDEMLALAERCEKAAGPDRELDEAIVAAVDAGVMDVPRALGLVEGPPRFTASLDAAMTLVPEGAKVTMQNFGGPGPMVLVEPNERFAAGTTPALALCAAALRARG
jgi:hypothetical protein